jgi:DNA-binding response OmpR family regulator
MTFDFQEPHGGDGSRPRILVVEPNRRYAAVLSRRLHEDGYRPVIAPDACAAIAELHRSAPDLALIDGRLPGASAIELLRIIRDEPAKRHLPVLILAGRSDPALAINAFEAGADAVIRKPFHFEVLHACIGRQLNRASAIRELQDDNAALDARVVSRAIEIGEVRAMLEGSEAERNRLQALVDQNF